MSETHYGGYYPGQSNQGNVADDLLARLAEPEILLLPCPYDAISARLAVEAGFDALFVGGYALAAARFAFPDVGLVSPTEMLEAARAIIAAAGVPVIVDGDTGYGGVANVKRTVHSLAQAGAAAVMIEDQQWPKRCGHLHGKQVVAREEAVTRIRAATGASAETGKRILIMARTDARAVLGLDEALWRMQAFADAGADLLFMEAPRTEAEMVAFTSLNDLPKMANMLEEGVTPILPPQRLAELGFAMAAYPVTLLGAAMHAVRAALASIGQGEIHTPRMSHGDILHITGYDAVQSAEREAGSAE
ncbi:MAG: isocitrate lyase/PEP mutase family protein [Jiangellales bacterium]